MEAIPDDGARVRLIAVLHDSNGVRSRSGVPEGESAVRRRRGLEGDGPSLGQRDSRTADRYRGARRHNGALRPGQDRNRLNVPVREAVLVEDNELNRVGPRVRVIVRRGATVAHGPVSELPDVRRDYAVRVERIRPVEGDRLTGDRPGGAPGHDADRGLRQD